MASILVIEDSPTQAQELQLVLASRGFDVEIAPSGEAGLARLEAGGVDLVLSDILLPGLSGYDVCRRIKAEPRTKNIPVVLLTVLRDPLDILQGLECGADNFITKPCNPAFLVRRVNALLANDGRRAGPPAGGRVELSFRGRGVTITSDKEQILDLLLATLEEFIHAREHEQEARIAREALERSQRFIQSALDALSTCVAVLDEAGTVLAVNGGWLRCGAGNPLCGAACPVGSNYLQACESAPGVEGARAAAEGIRAVMGRRSAEFAGAYSHGAPGDRHWWTVRATRFAEAGRVRVVVAHEDVTAGKRLEEALRRRGDELAETDRRKTEFLAMLAHELRSPLAPLLNSLSVLDLPDLSPQAREQTRQVMGRQLRHLSRLVDDLLDVSRISRGKVQLHTERLDLARLVRTAAEDHRPLLEQAGLALTVEAPETPVWVQGDPARLIQVLANLLDNARKFSDRGGRVGVRLAADREQGQALLAVRDTGLGVEAEMLPRLFDTFAQADRSLERTRGGLGLGLAVVKGLVELHGGAVEAASAGRGQGTEFAVRLRLEPEPAALAAPPRGVQAVRQRLRVLVVEDNLDAAESLQLLLELLGHEVKAAYTGPAGVETARAWQPDIVLCDIGLPGLDGYGVARELRLHPTTARVRLLALTGYGSDEDRRLSRLAGFDAHLTKPVAPETLVEYLVRPETQE
jgi:signal transduction histidine kinase/DNA-binding response OmpR family regulator